MKKITICLSFAALFLMACGGEKAPAAEEAIEEMEVTVDSTALKMHNTAEDLEESTNELDELLNDI